MLQYQFLGHKLSFSLGALPGATGVVAGSHRSLGRLDMAQVSWPSHPTGSCANDRFVKETFPVLVF
ncbi:MAG: hypothetical protein F6K25_14140 [Okeania sp. SIO2G4]|uniref:hypothetical protein n=1 Tax=unclassified Okeania TaxID=2634635 RepID=UPI0013B8A873|nr:MULTISPECIES: hypothetical protein [unclassified Okeania]NEP06307.1 hypothetical protein [Okeania sp. SIO4D6]NEP93086.1 hypothetical protein [Okeania sp. SIO2F5]NEQ91772.1 hypothetical protein [Okeania sp. SIO2G4]